MGIVNKIKIGIYCLFCMCVLVTLSVPVMSKANDKTVAKNSFSVEYIDVGQGDCALIQCDGHYMMIDGGPSKASSVVYTILKNKGINNIDLIVATHPDEDHIGGLSGALNYAKAGKILSPVATHDTKTFQSLLKYINKQGKSITVPKVGDEETVGSAKVKVIGPVYDSADTNNKSIVVKITYGKNSFIFMGDAEKQEESDILRKYGKLDCDVLKVGHHGSSSSTTKSLLKSTMPDYAVISVGKGNKYGHPTEQTLNRLTQENVQIFRTDLQGDITFYSDGKNITVETEKNVSTDLLKTSGDKEPATVNSSAYVLNTNTKKFHIPTCSSVNDMKQKNRKDVNMSRDEIISNEYKPCKRCNP